MVVGPRRSGRAPNVMRSVAAAPHAVLRPPYRPVQDLLGLVHPSRQWRRSRCRKEQPVVKSRCVVLIVAETESEAALYMRVPGRPRKSAPEHGKQEGKQEAQQASKAHKRKEERAAKEEEEEQEIAQKRTKGDEETHKKRAHIREKGTQVEYRDNGQRTTALVTALWRAPCIRRWFVQLAIVWFGGAKPRASPHGHPPPLRAHCGGGGRPATVWWWNHGQRRGSDVCHREVPVLGQRDQEGENRGADENRTGHASKRNKRSGNRERGSRWKWAGAMHARCKGAAPVMRRGPPGPYPSRHTDQELREVEREEGGEEQCACAM